MSTDLHTLSGAYALDALTPEEAAEFRRHLQTCRPCRDEVRELREAAARVGAALAVAPPPSLRQRVLDAATRTPQLPRSARPERVRRGRGVRWAAAAAAAVVVSAGAALGVRAVLDEPADLAPAAAKVFEAPDARTATLETVNGGRVRVGVSAARNEMAVDTSALPDAGEGRVYQLWAVHGDEMVSAAVLADPEAGAAMAMPEPDTEVAITVEPEGGSEAPTGAPIVQVDPRAV